MQRREFLRTVEVSTLATAAGVLAGQSAEAGTRVAAGVAGASLLFLGGATLGDFALALIVGIVVGTVSTIVVAGPVSILLQQRWTGPAPRTSGAKQPVGKAGRRHPSKADRARRRAGDGAVV